VGPSKTARSAGLCALINGDSEPCYGSTGKMDSESTLYLLPGLGARRRARRCVDGGQRRRRLGAGAVAAGAAGAEFRMGLHEGNTAAITHLCRWLALLSLFSWLSEFA
jgi:hypothetical protein